MTAVSPLVGTSEPELLPGDLIDALIEAVVLPPDPYARSVVICSLVNEMCAALEWLDGDETTLGDNRDEAISVRRLASAAQDHHLRMTLLDAGTAAGRTAPGRPAAATSRAQVMSGKDVYFTADHDEGRSPR